VTVSWTAGPDAPSADALIDVVPGRIAVTTPSAEIEATAKLLDAHVNGRPVSIFPSSSSVTAVACAVSLICKLVESTVTTTNETGAGRTISDSDCFTPSTATEIVADPGAIAVTSPVAASAVAIAVSDVDHVTVRPTSAVCFASNTAAVSCAPFPTRMMPGSPEISMLATAGGPDGSPPHATMKASVASHASVSRGRVFIGIFEFPERGDRP